MTLQIFVFGAGPRTRAIAASLLRRQFPGAFVANYETLAGAVAQARYATANVLLWDARVAPDGGAALLAGPVQGAAAGYARSFLGETRTGPAAFGATGGAALEALMGNPPANGPLVGTWFSQEAPPPREPSGHRVNVRANGLGFTGYATAARHMMIGMHEAGAQIRWSDDWVEGEEADMPPADRALLESFKGDPDGCDVTIVHNTPTDTDGTPFLQRYRDTIIGNRPLICATMFEADAIPSRWAAQLNRCEGVWVPCSQNVESFARSGVRRELLHMVPIGLDIENYDIDGPAADFSERRGFNFFSVFEWRLRKGYDVLLRAYARAFGKNDDVALFLRTSMVDLDVHGELRKQFADLGLDPREMAPIFFLPDKIPQLLLPSVYRAMDAFVLPSRGEAFGIPYVEAMALGLPAIGTAFGGPIDYLTTETGFPVPCTLTDVDSAFSEKMAIYRGLRWAEPSVEATAAAMRAVFDHRADARATAAVGTAAVRTRYNRVRTGRDALEALRDVPRSLPPRSAAAAKLYYIGIAASIAGYGSETRAFLSALDRQGIGAELAMYSYEDVPDQLRPEEAQLIKRSTRLRAPESAPVLYHLLPTQAGEIPEGRFSIVRTMEETDGLAEGWLEALRRFDQVWLPSTFNAQTFERAGVDPKRIRIVPGAIDTDFWSPSTGGVSVPGAAGFRFLAVFDWMGRKGWDLLVHAFMRAFSIDDDVSLTLKVTDLVSRAEGRVLNTTDVIGEVARAAAPDKLRTGRAPRMIVLSERLSEDALAKLYTAHHAFVGPSHAEGWGRAHMEAMSCGLPTIGTRWGGNLAFMNDENSYLIDIEGLIEAKHDTSRYVGRRWAQPSVEHLEQLLRRVYSNRLEARERGKAARREIVAKFSLDAIGATLRTRLEEITQLDFPAPQLTAKAPTQTVNVLIDARAPANSLAACIDRIVRHTRDAVSISVLTTPQHEREIRTLAQHHAGAIAVYSEYETLMKSLPAAEYTAVVRGDVLLSVAWDRVLVEALNTQFSAASAVPRFFGIGLQSENTPEPVYDTATAEFFDQFAIHCMIHERAKGAGSLSFPPLCMLLKTSLYAPAAPHLFPTTFPAGTSCWTAFDCVGHFVAPKAS